MKKLKIKIIRKDYSKSGHEKQIVTIDLETIENAVRASRYQAVKDFDVINFNARLFKYSGGGKIVFGSYIKYQYLYDLVYFSDKNEQVWLEIEVEYTLENGETDRITIKKKTDFSY